MLLTIDYTPALSYLRPPDLANTHGQYSSMPFFCINFKSFSSLRLCLPSCSSSTVQLSGAQQKRSISQRSHSATLSKGNLSSLAIIVPLVTFGGTGHRRSQ